MATFVFPSGFEFEPVSLLLSCSCRAIVLIDGTIWVYHSQIMCVHFPFFFMIEAKKLSHENETNMVSNKKHLVVSHFLVTCMPTL